MMKRLLIYAALLVLAANCSDDDDTARTSTAAPCAKTGQKSWAVDISPIFNKNCASCHPGQQKTNYSTYAGVKSNITEEKSRIDANTMPLPPATPLEQTDKDAIAEWIAANMPDKVCE